MIIDKINQSKKLITISLFIFIFFVGVSVVKDYGVSSDEYQHRLHGFTNLNYVGEKLFPNITERYKKDKLYPKFEDYNNNWYGGVLYNASTAFLELLFGIKDKKNQFLFKHYFNYLIFFLSLISFYQLVQSRFSDWKYSLLGVTILFLSPRIFANSFYNINDLIFMSFCIFAMNYAFIFFKNPNIRNSLLFSFFVALAINMRIMGIIIPFLFFGILFFYLLINKVFLKNYSLPLLITFFLIPFFTVLFWPYLWDDPIKNFINSFVEVSKYYHFGGSENLFLGNFVMSTNVPWNYIPVWILITTPIVYLILFFAGVVKISLSTIFFKREKNIRLILTDLFFLLFILLSIISVIVLNSTLYNGWRHMYFIYPAFVMIALVGIEFFLKIIKNKYVFIIFQLIIIFTFINTSYWMVKNHPHQNVYFNRLAGKNIQNKFEMDYWGLSYKENLDYLLKIDERDKLYIWNSSRIKMFYPLLSLNEKDRSKIVIVENKNDAEYWITNYYIDKKIYDEEFYKKYELIREIVVDGDPINSIFKKK